MYNWGFVDKIYCICITERDDRYQESMEQFKKVGLTPSLVQSANVVEYYRPNRDRSTHVKRPSARGGWESHRHLITTSYNAGHRYILIFEDDVYFNKYMCPERLQHIAHCMKHKLPDKWDIFFLGHFPYFSLPRTGNVWRVWAEMCHAYIIDVTGKVATYIREHSYDSLRQGMYGHPCIDRIYMTKAKAFAYYPMVALQSGSPSCNPKKGPFAFVVDFVLKHSRTTAPMMEFFTNFVPWMVVSFFLFLFLAKKLFRCRR